MAGVATPAILAIVACRRSCDELRDNMPEDTSKKAEAEGRADNWSGKVIERCFGSEHFAVLVERPIAYAMSESLLGGVVVVMALFAASIALDGVDERWTAAAGGAAAAAAGGLYLCRELCRREGTKKKEP